MTLRIEVRPHTDIDRCVEFIKEKPHRSIETNRPAQTIEVLGAQHGLYHDLISAGFDVKEI